jgi:hypothetical protein
MLTSHMRWLGLAASLAAAISITWVLTSCKFCAGAGSVMCMQLVLLLSD